MKTMLNKYGIRVSFLVSFIGLLISLPAFALDYPHSPANFYDCATCHDLFSSNLYLLTDWTGDYVMQDDDDTPLNHLCRSCHYSGGPAAAHNVHSFLGMGYTSGTSPYGMWQVQCTTCHNPHYQDQGRRYVNTGDTYWQFKSQIDTVTVLADTSTLKAQGTPGWAADEYINMKVVPNVDAKYPSAYKIISNDSDTLTVKGRIDTTAAASGNIFAIVYGRLIRDQISLGRIINPLNAKSGFKRVRFFGDTGDNSFADGNGIYDGVCEVCHTETQHFQNDGTSPDQQHNNMGPVAGTDCTVCHTPESGFRPSCNVCHSYPPSSNAHSLHVTTMSYACDECHYNNNHNSSGITTTPAQFYNDYNRALVDVVFASAGFNSDANNGTVLGLPAYTPNASSSLGSCANLTCHNPDNAFTGKGTDISTDNRPVWGNTITSCNACHTNSDSSDPDGGDHFRHESARANHGQLVDCIECHSTININTPETSGTEPKHANKVLNIDQSGDYPVKVDADLPYMTGITGPYADGAPGSTIGSTCANIYCHGNATFKSDTSWDKTFTWGATVVGTICHDCHRQYMTWGSSANQRHFVHLDTSYLGWVYNYGPGMGEATCGGCHNVTNANHANGREDFNGSADGTMANSTACDTCHSTGGTYDGVNANMIGAKANWNDGVYSGSALQAGKEKWCATCHDESPSLVKGIDAPNVIGDEDGSYAYGTGWGYYTTGHGLSSDESYPSSGGVTAGAGAGCLECHDPSAKHMDTLARTFDDGNVSTGDASLYRQGYRLKLVAAGQGAGATTQEPMLIPWPQNTSNSVNNYRLCVNCHNSEPFTDPANMNTNMVTDGVNRHEYHLGPNVNQLRYSSDWDGTLSSRINCVACHNVHGSTRMAMIRDKKLIDPSNVDLLLAGLRIWYNDDSVVTYSTSNTDPPTPENLPLSASIGTVWSGGSAGNLCSHCHGNVNTVPEYRAPFQNVDVVPVLDWTGEVNYLSDGANPDSAPGGTFFELRIKYTDGNNDPPLSIDALVDRNDDTDYADAGEVTAMAEVDAGDTNYTDGKIYSISMQLAKAGDNVLPYKFTASDNDGSALLKDPVTAGGEVTVTNAVPLLDWTGTAGYETDGVAPNSSQTGSTFVFRVKYTDPDNEAPSSINALFDMDGNGSFEEQYAMSALGDGDGDHTNGENYTYSRIISTIGVYDFKFAASDGIDPAAGNDPVSIAGAVTVTSASNTAPVLSWTAEAGYSADGVNPDADAGGRPFTFRVLYLDADNDAPTTIEVWIDENDDTLYQAGEKYSLTEDNAGDTDYSDGKLYALRRYVEHYGGANKIEPIHYRFYANDINLADATGAPVSDSIMSLQDAIKVPGEAATITAAIASAVAGDIVLVAPGSYNEYINFNGKDDITLLATDDPDGASPTILTDKIYAGNQNGGADNVTIYGFKVTSIQPSIFDFNASLITVDNCLFDSNAGNSVYVNGTDKVTVQNSTFQNNTDESVYLTSVGGFIDVFNSTFTGNSGNLAGAIYLNTSATVNLTSSLFSSNTSTANGGAIHCNNCTMNLDDSIFTGNSTAVGGQGGALYLNSAASRVTVTDTFIQGNSAGIGGGGGIYIENGSHADLTNVMLTGNMTTGNGGAIHDKGSFDCLFCTISGNAAVKGGGFYLLNSLVTTVRDSIIYNNSASSPSNASYIQVETNTRWSYADISNTLINQPPGSAVWPATLSYEDLGGNDIVSNPDFVNGLNPASAPTAGGDYHLQTGSPAVDAGVDPAPVVLDHDIFGGIRPINGYDMGAHEKE